MRELNKLKQEKLIFYDLESAPLVKELQLDTPLFDSWSYKVNRDGHKITDNEVIEIYSEQAGLYPEFSKIITIVVGKIIDGKIVLITLDDPDEKVILNSFNRLLERNPKDRLIGFANIGFDTPFVFKRMLINGIVPNDRLDSSGMKPWDVDEIDLSVLWKATSFSRASLINIATAFGLPSPKDDISGADVGRVYWSEGEKGLKRIASYCRKDVVTTINVFRKMRLEEPLEVSDSDKPVEDEKLPLLEHLMSGGAYGKKEKEQLMALIGLTDSTDRDRLFVILDAVTSTARGKKTKFTKTHVKALRKEFENV